MLKEKQLLSNEHVTLVLDMHDNYIWIKCSVMVNKVTGTNEALVGKWLAAVSVLALVYKAYRHTFASLS